jgi:hypothetical protein
MRFFIILTAQDPICLPLIPSQGAVCLLARFGRFKVILYYFRYKGALFGVLRRRFAVAFPKWLALLQFGQSALDGFNTLDQFSFVLADFQLFF